MLDMLAMIVRLLMLADQIGGQRSAAPLAAVRLSVHPGKSSLEILRRHVMPVRQAAVGQRSAVAKVVTGTRPTGSHDLSNAP